MNTPIIIPDKDDSVRGNKVRTLRQTVRRLINASVDLARISNWSPDDYQDVVKEHDRAQADYNRACDALKVWP